MQDLEILFNRLQYVDLLDIAQQLGLLSKPCQIQYLTTKSQLINMLAYDVQWQKIPSDQFASINAIMIHKYGCPIQL